MFNPVLFASSSVITQLFDFSRKLSFPFSEFYSFSHKKLYLFLGGRERGRMKNIKQEKVEIIKKRKTAKRNFTLL
jgi:hypothetical protein